MITFEKEKGRKGEGENVRNRRGEKKKKEQRKDQVRKFRGEKEDREKKEMKFRNKKIEFLQAELLYTVMSKSYL